MEQIWKFWTKETGLAIAILITISVLVFVWGCESTTKSLLDPNIRITREQLAGEIALLQSRIQQATKDIDSQDLIKEELFNQALIYGTTGAVNPIGVITALGTILGIGTTADNIRKRKQIARLKTAATA